jgi:hypothetical protein
MILEQVRLLTQLQRNDKKMSRVMEIARLLGQENLPMSNLEKSHDKTSPVSDSKEDIVGNLLVQ